jgi:hypothetical protein
VIYALPPGNMNITVISADVQAIQKLFSDFSESFLVQLIHWLPIFWNEVCSSRRSRKVCEVLQIKP